MKLSEKPNENFILKLTKSFSTPFWLCGRLGSIQVGVDYHSKWNLIQLFSFPYIFSQVALTHTIDLMHMKFNFSHENIPNNLSIQFQPLWFNMRRLMLCFDDKQDIPLKFLHGVQSSFNYYCQKQLIFNIEKTLVLGYEKGILPKNIENHIQFVQFTKLFLSISNNNNINFDIQNLVHSFRLLPNVDCLDVELKEFEYWLMNDSIIEKFHFFFQHLHRLVLDCSSIVNKEMNQQIMKPLLLCILNKNYFFQLKSLQFICKNISSSWINIDEWIDFILHRIDQHQLTSFRFDFIEKQQEEITTNLQTGNDIIRNNEYSSIIHIHRFISTHNFCFWIHRK